MIIPESALKKKYSAASWLDRDIFILAVNLSNQISRLEVGSNCYRLSTGSALVDLFVPIQCSAISYHPVAPGGFVLLPLHGIGLSKISFKPSRKPKRKALAVIPMQLVQGTVSQFTVDSSITFTEVKDR